MAVDLNTSADGGSAEVEPAATKPARAQVLNDDRWPDRLATAMFAFAFLVVVSTETGREVARVACVREAFDGKVPDTTYGTTPDPAGKRTLTWVRIKGETSQHKVVAP